ncbi:hypothetical protein FB451DRAFT_1188099 [Mycena latifolia]|nr:hypothetical protein FB451DRAFT_1188099 [Mycena latifolia]
MRSVTPASIADVLAVKAHIVTVTAFPNAPRRRDFFNQKEKKERGTQADEEPLSAKLRGEWEVSGASEVGWGAAPGWDVVTTEKNTARTVVKSTTLRRASPAGLRGNANITGGSTPGLWQDRKDTKCLSKFAFQDGKDLGKTAQKTSKEGKTIQLLKSRTKINYIGHTRKPTSNAHIPMTPTPSPVLPQQIPKRDVITERWALLRMNERRHRPGDWKSEGDVQSLWVCGRITDLCSEDCAAGQSAWCGPAGLQHSHFGALMVISGFSARACERGTRGRGQKRWRTVQQDQRLADEPSVAHGVDPLEVGDLRRGCTQAYKVTDPGIVTAFHGVSTWRRIGQGDKHFVEVKGGEGGAAASRQEHTGQGERGRRWWGKEKSDEPKSSKSRHP